MNGASDQEGQIDSALHSGWLFRDGRDANLPPNHPINKLGAWRKFACLATLSYAGFLANFSIAIILDAFEPLAEQFEVKVPTVPNSIGYSLLGLAVGPLFWNPLSKTLGRRPVYLLGSTMFIPFVIWEARANTWASFCLARTFAALASSFSQTVPPATIADIFVKQVRGSKMSMYGVAVVMAPALAPVFCGLIVNASSWRNIFWFNTGLAALQLVLFFVFVPETLWIADDAPVQENPVELADSQDKNVAVQAEHGQAAVLPTGHVGAAWMPWSRPSEYLGVVMSPILMFRYLPILLPSIYYGSLFAWSVGLTVVVPQILLPPPYEFATVPLGAAYLAFGIGAVLGKWSGGIVGDKTVAYFERRNSAREPEDRLYALLPILPLMLVALAIVGVAISKELPWIALLIGGALFYFCLSVSTGILQTYVLECYLSRSMDTQAVFIFWKCIWGFAIPFFAFQWGLKTGFLSAYATQGALATGVGALVSVGFIWKGKAIRHAQHMI